LCELNEFIRYVLMSPPNSYFKDFKDIVTNSVMKQI